MFFVIQNQNFGVGTHQRQEIKRKRSNSSLGLQLTSEESVFDASLDKGQLSALASQGLGSFSFFTYLDA